MTADALFWLAIGSAIATCFAACGARALRAFSRHDLEDICLRRNRPERFSAIVRQYDRVCLGVELMVAPGLVLLVVSGMLYARARFDLPMPPTAAQFALLVAVLGTLLVAIVVIFPWSLARVAAAGFLYFTWPVWRLMSTLATPLVWLAQFFDMVVHRVAGRAQEQADEESFEEEIRTIVSEGHREGLLEEDAREMIEGVIELGDADVSQIMTPRTDMHMVQVDLPWDELLADVIASGHTRIPVYDKNRDDIIGILYSKDLLPELANGNGQKESHRPLVELLRKPVFVPESKAVDDVLQMFQQTHTHIAVVLDEYGGVSGLVTIEDVLEEIVGEIVDEYDSDVEIDITKIDHDTCEALGRAHVDEINEAMGLALPEDADYDTIGGFVFSEMGRVPLKGEQLVWQDEVQVTVLDASKRRVERVRIERINRESREIA